MLKQDLSPTGLSPTSVVPRLGTTVPTRVLSGMDGPLHLVSVVPPEPHTLRPEQHVSVLPWQEPFDPRDAPPPRVCAHPSGPRGEGCPVSRAGWTSSYIHVHGTFAIPDRSLHHCFLGGRSLVTGPVPARHVWVAGSHVADTHPHPHRRTTRPGDLGLSCGDGRDPVTLGTAGRSRGRPRSEWSKPSVDNTGGAPVCTAAPRVSP